MVYLDAKVPLPTTALLIEMSTRKVLHWVSEGKRDSEIAIILGISVRTVEQQVRVCLGKLGVENRAAAVATVWRVRQGTCRSGD